MEFKYEGKSLKSGIYKITNKLDGMFYVGSAKCFKKRGYQHCWHLEKGTHSNIHLQRAFNIVGTDAFIFEVLEVVEGDKATRMVVEQRYLDDIIDTWDKCYNFQKTTITTERSCWSHTPEETGKKISAAKLGSKHSEETKRKMSIAKKGRKFSEEHRLNLSKAHKGHIVSAVSKEKISKALTGKQISDETRKKMVIARNLRSKLQ